jgi:hypothetical protein
MPEDVVREAVVVRYAVTHELTPEGTLIIVEDQVVTDPPPDLPLGEEVPADPIVPDTPPVDPPPGTTTTSGTVSTSSWAAPTPTPAPAPAPTSTDSEV